MASVRHIDRQDLEVEELEITSAPLTAAAFHYGKYCKEANDTFIKCRYVLKDPRKCLNEGKVVTNCAHEFFKKVKLHCDESFQKQFTCLDYNNYEFKRCRKTQKLFDHCMDTVFYNNNNNNSNNSNNSNSSN